MKQLELIHKYGAPAVLFLWLASVQYQMSGVQEKLDECQEQRINDIMNIRKATTSADTDFRQLLAVLPEEPRIKSTR